MQNLTSPRIVRAAVLAGLAVLPLATHVSLRFDRVRVKIIATPSSPASGMVRATTADFAQVYELQPPFALIARVNTGSNATFAVAIDGATVCARPVSGRGTRRLDCDVTGAWNRATEHELMVQGPLTRWTLDYLELATHHGNTDGFHSVFVLPAGSRAYRPPAIGWVIAVWVAFTAMLLVPTPRLQGRWIRLVYRVVAGAILLELAIILLSEWVSRYRLVLSIGTFVLWLTVLISPRLWALLRLMATRPPLVGVPGVRRSVALFAALLLAVGIAAAWQLLQDRTETITSAERHATGRQRRQNLLDELQPVRLKNCRLRRFGGRHDGGYLMCENLIKGAESAYSYGIAGEDNWGCDLSTKYDLAVHQYDCFDTRQPVCEGGHFAFHSECIAGITTNVESRPYDTLIRQISRNGDAGKRLIVKMDVEGAEWDALLATPDSVLDRIAQLPMEFHGTNGPRFLELVRKLKRTFHLVHIHFNNWACTKSVQPFPSSAFQVLWVNKRIGILDDSAQPPVVPNPADAPDNPELPDCQLVDVNSSG
jgi:hypothetical protein